MGRKGEETKSKIIESATHCLLHLGDRKTTFQTIADHSGYSEALVIRYLKSRDDIFAHVLDYWIKWATEETLKALDDAGTAEDRLRAYLRVSVGLFTKSEFARVYLLLHYFAGVEEKYRAINTQIKRAAVARISKMIEDGIAEGVFRKVDVSLAAKAIHNDLVGNVLSAITETPEPFHMKLPSALEENAISRLKKVS